MKPEINNIDKPDLDELLERDSTGVILLPKELDEAPEEIKAFYIKWLEVGERSQHHPKRYFQFVNRGTGAVEQIDLLGLPGRIQMLAKEKNIDPTELPLLDSLVKEFIAMKTEKTVLRWKWGNWLKPRMGKDVFDWRKADILDMYARYMTHDEIKAFLEKEGYNISSHHLYKFFIKHKDTIDKKRFEFLKTAKDHYLATDAGRMETLAILHAKFMRIFNDLYAVPNPSMSTRQELKSISGEIRGIIEQARKEIKGEELRLTIDGKIDINASLAASETIQDISKRIPIQMIPIYLVAAKQGISPHNLLTSLTTSFYKDYNGFGKLKGGTPPLTNDIIRNYNWDEIRIFHQEDRSTEQFESIDVYEAVPEAQVEAIMDKRELLLKMLNEQAKGGEDSE